MAACGTGPVSVEGHDHPTEAALPCASLIDGLPESVAGVQRRDVEPADAPAAAWGDPAIVLRCGVPRPEGLDKFATCQEADGVGWYVPEEQVTGSPLPLTITTVDREVFVEVFLPEKYWPPAVAMIDLAPAISGALEQTSPCV